jgi:hypothetical protein
MFSNLNSFLSEEETVKRKLATLCVIWMVFLLTATPAAAGKKQLPPGLSPGQFVVFEQDVPINLVFVGYDEANIDVNEVLDVLPATYEPVVRYPQFYGLPGRPLGLHFDFLYNTVFTDAAFENRFFKFLDKIGVTGEPTLFQLFYNDMETNVLDVTAPVLYIDGPTVEKYLTDQAPLLGVNPHKGYTIFFINWYGRPDFKFHVYTKTDQPDPDTGYNFGVLRDSRKMIAWGGSHSRTWFYDLSAGPEAWTDNWAVDLPDLDGNGVEDYRMPAIWEYTPGGYRDPAALSSDLGMVTRFVGINLLFTTSPLYDPLVTTPGLDGSKVVHVEMFEDDPASSGLDWINMGLVYDKFKAFQPYYSWTTGLEDNDPIDLAAQRALRIWAELLGEDDCWNAFGTPFAELFCYFDANFNAYIPAYGPSDYVGAFFSFNTTADNLGTNYGLLGYSDDNWVDGTQSYVFSFDTEDYRSLGYGFSTTTIHEGGHHFGMSHPHDGYDSEYGIDYGPGDDFYFAWSGDESNTIMHYMDLSQDFGQFDQDNLYRYEFAGYMNWANALLSDIMAHPQYKTVKPWVVKAKARASLAVKAFAKWNYLGAASNAYAAYSFLLRAANQLGIPTIQMNPMLRIAPTGNAPHEGDPIRFPDN